MEQPLTTAGADGQDKCFRSWATDMPKRIPRPPPEERKYDLSVLTESRTAVANFSARAFLGLTTPKYTKTRELGVYSRAVSIAVFSLHVKFSLQPL